jgi:hypothetical protein
LKISAVSHLYKQIESDKASVSDPGIATKVYAFADEEMLYLWQSNLDRDWKIYDKQVSRFRFNWEEA